MNAYEIYNTASSESLGIYHGNTEEEAIRAMMKDAGCDDEPGDDLKAVMVLRCAYCGSEEWFRTDAKVPAVDDDEAWGKLAEKHERYCEWVQTRAHRIDSEK